MKALCNLLKFVDPEVEALGKDFIVFGIAEGFVCSLTVGLD